MACHRTKNDLKLVSHGPHEYCFDQGSGKKDGAVREDNLVKERGSYTQLSLENVANWTRLDEVADQLNALDEGVSCLTARDCSNGKYHFVWNAYGMGMRLVVLVKIGDVASRGASYLN